MKTPSIASRRRFLRHVATFGGIALSTPAALRLGLSDASAQTAGDYKALVCCYLNGGNDHIASVEPYDLENYNALRALRPSTIAERAALLPIRPITAQGGLEAALHPAMVAMKSLFDQKRLAIV